MAIEDTLRLEAKNQTNQAAADILNHAAAVITKLRDKNTKLISRLKKLHALEAAGVDNWEGYDYAMQELSEDDE
jgi:hypothetical protein